MIKKGDIFKSGLVVYSEPIETALFSDMEEFANDQQFCKGYISIPHYEGVMTHYMFNSGCSIFSQESLDKWREFVCSWLQERFDDASGNLFIYDFNSESEYHKKRLEYTRSKGLPDEHDYRLFFDNPHFQERYEFFLNDIHRFYADKKSGDYVGD